MKEKKTSSKRFIPCKYRDIIYADRIESKDKDAVLPEFKPRSDWDEQRKKAKWQRAFCLKNPLTDDAGRIHSFWVYNDFDFIGQTLKDDVKIYNPIHILLIKVLNCIYDKYTKFKISLTGKIANSLINEIKEYLEFRDIEISEWIEDAKNEKEKNIYLIHQNELLMFKNKFEYLLEKNK